MSLVSWIWGALVGKVRELILSIVDPIKDWVRNALKALGDILDSLRAAWENFTSKTLPDIWKAIEDLGKKIAQNIETNITNLTEYVTNVYNYMTEHVTNINKYVTENITNVNKYVTEHITYVTGTTQEWVRNFVAGLIPADFVKDPVGYIRAAVDLSAVIPADFIKDPLGYIGAAFNGLIEAWMLVVLQSLQEGLEEGLKQAEEELERG